jgi:hypothetical protein
MKLELSYQSLLMSTLTVVGLLVAFAGSGFAQSSIDSGPQKPEDKLEQIEAEMRSKSLISHAQKEHKQNVSRAQLVSCLGSEIGTTFKQKNRLDRDDLKKLDKLEKLTKSIRSASGGSDDATEIEKMPADLPAVISKMAELTEALREEVEKTPRQVVSTTVIDHANVLLELIRRVRDLSART